MKLNDNHPFLTSAASIREIIAPLKRHHINYFTYNRNYHDGNRISLTTNEKYLKTFYEEQHYLRGNIDAKPKLYLNQAALFTTLPNQKILQWARVEFNVAHGIHIIRDTQDYVEFFTFASTPEHPEILNFYLNHLDSLQNFCDYFLESSKKLLIDIESYKHILPYHNKGLRPCLPPTQISDILAKSSHRRELSLTPRERDLIQPLIEGKTSKEISVLLNLSPRTVDFYLVRMRKKFNASNTRQLIIKLLQSSQ